MNTRRGLLSVSCLKPNPNNPVVIFHSLSIASLTVATADRGRWIIRVSLYPLVATSADSVPSSNLVRITIAPIGTTFGNLQWRRYKNNFTFEYSSNNNIFSFVAMSADSVPSSKTNIFQNKLIYCRLLELIRGAQCLIEVIPSSGEEMWRIDAYQIPYYSRGIEGEKRTHSRFADWEIVKTSYKLRRLSIYSFDQITTFPPFQSCFIYHVLTMCFYLLMML